MLKKYVVSSHSLNAEKSGGETVSTGKTEWVQEFKQVETLVEFHSKKFPIFGVKKQYAPPGEDYNMRY